MSSSTSKTSKPRTKPRTDAGAGPPPIAAAPASVRKASVDRKDSLLSCLLCCHVIDNLERFNTVGACGHTGCCSLCALRLRQLLGSSGCSICKAELPRVICIAHDSQTFDSFQDWGDNIGPTHVFDEASGMFFFKDDYPTIRKLRDPVCRKCDKKFASIPGLKTHLQDVHQLQYCGICLDHKHAFLGEMALFTKEQLKSHSTKGNPREGFPGHPRCDFCFTRFYSNAELFDHLHKNHFECDICVRSHGVQNRYYKDYNDLENHFRAEHFLCEEPTCLAHKFVVFKTHIDMQAHLAKEHPHIKTSRKIDVHFTVRRATRDGAGTAQTNDGFDDYEHGGRDRDRVINVADFPSLTDTNAPAGMGLFWENQTVSRPRAEDFPALGVSAGRAAPTVGAAPFRNALAPPPTPAMLAHMNQGNQWEYPELAAAAEALGANNPFMRFVKPAKGKMKRKAKPSPTATASSAARAQLEDDGDEEKAAAPSHAEEEDEEEESKAPAMSKSALVLKIRQTLGTDAKYEVFREACKKFRTNEADVASFYAKIRSMFSPEDFEKLFLKLMKLSPDQDQVHQVFAYHRSLSKQANQAQGFQSKQGKKKNVANDKPAPINHHNNSKPKPKKAAVPAAASGWATALHQSGLSPAATPPPIVVRAPQLPSRPEARSMWTSSSPSGSVAAVSSTEMPVSTKITSAPIESFAALAVAGASPSSSTYAQSTMRAPVQPSTFRSTKSDFPELPKAGKPVGVQAVTRATWNDQVQAIAQNRPVAKAASTGKKNKKKSMTLGELAMQFS